MPTPADGPLIATPTVAANASLLFHDGVQDTSRQMVHLCGGARPPRASSPAATAQLSIRSCKRIQPAAIAETFTMANLLNFAGDVNPIV